MTKTTVDLTKHYPMSPIYTLRANVPWLVAAGVMALVALVVNSDFIPFSSSQVWWLAEFPSRIVLPTIGLIIFVVFRILHTYLLMKTIYYGIEGDDFVLREGFFIKDERRFPLLFINDCHMQRDLLDLTFRLAHVTLRIAASNHSAIIPGLSMERAESLERIVVNSVGAAQRGESNPAGAVLESHALAANG